MASFSSIVPWARFGGLAASRASSAKRYLALRFAPSTNRYGDSPQVDQIPQAGPDEHDHQRSAHRRDREEVKHQEGGCPARGRHPDGRTQPHPLGRPAGRGTFRHPFVLTALETTQPAGTSRLVIEIPGLSFLAWRRSATSWPAMPWNGPPSWRRTNGTRTYSARDGRKVGAFGSFRAVVACARVKHHHLSPNCCIASAERSPPNVPKIWSEMP